MARYPCSRSDHPIAACSRITCLISFRTSGGMVGLITSRGELLGSTKSCRSTECETSSLLCIMVLLCMYACGDDDASQTLKEYRSPASIRCTGVCTYIGTSPGKSPSNYRRCCMYMYTGTFTTNTRLPASYCTLNAVATFTTARPSQA